VLDEVVGERSGPYFEAMVARRAAGEPLQYVLGRWAFRAIEVMVDPRVLIPRPETEQVVEVALRELDRQGVAEPVVVDLGTGSGAIAISLAAERRPAQVWATDRSADALAVAGANVAGHAARRVRLAEGSWWDALPATLRGQVHLAVSNPPYVSDGEMGSLDAVVAEWEPHTALVAGPDGTEDLALVINGAPGWLAPGGAVVVEIAPHQVDRVTALAVAAGLVEVSQHRDLAGRYRAVAARQPLG
jgi:release factor glutamine methyltransferase